MYDNAVPVYEMKNKLSFYLHKVDAGERIYISVRGKPTYIIQTIDDFEEATAAKPKEKSFLVIARELRQKHGLTDNDFDIDITEYFDSLRDRNYIGRPGSENIFDGV